MALQVPCTSGSVNLHRHLTQAHSFPPWIANRCRLKNFVRKIVPLYGNRTDNNNKIGQFSGIIWNKTIMLSFVSLLLYGQLIASSNCRLMLIFIQNFAPIKTVVQVCRLSTTDHVTLAKLLHNNNNNKNILQCLPWTTLSQYCYSLSALVATTYLSLIPWESTPNGPHLLLDSPHNLAWDDRRNERATAATASLRCRLFDCLFVCLVDWSFGLIP